MRHSKSKKQRMSQRFVVVEILPDSPKPRFISTTSVIIAVAVIRYWDSLGVLLRDREELPVAGRRETTGAGLEPWHMEKRKQYNLRSKKID